MIAKDCGRLLWELVKPLRKQVPIYINTVPEDENSQPDNFILLRPDIVNNTSVWGDGVSLMRKSECDIIISEAGSGNSEHSGEIVAEVERLLSEKEIPYKKYSAGAVLRSNTVETTITVNL